MSRPGWDTFFLDLADSYAARSTCDRLRVGCVLVQDRRLVAAGYNGSLPGLPHCDEFGHDLAYDLAGVSTCRRVVHAETNAIAQAADMGISTRYAAAYITHSPCLNCCKLLIAAGITAIFYRRPYKLDEHVAAMCISACVTLLHTPAEQEAS